MEEITQFSLPFSLQCSECQSLMEASEVLKAQKIMCNRYLAGEYLSSTIFEYHFPCRYCKSPLAIKYNLEQCKYEVVAGCSKLNKAFSRLNKESSVSRINQIISLNAMAT